LNLDEELLQQFFQLLRKIEEEELGKEAIDGVTTVT